MPTLKQLTCNVEWASSRVPLQEYHTIYADGYVETFIAVPSTPAPFSVHLQSHGYIAPGIAMFMDGVYQCNRNRRNLEIPDERTTRKETEIDFVVRQKEELLWDGTFEGRQWRFEKVKIVPDPDVKNTTPPPHDGEYVGTIEVVVLRCHQANKQPIIGNRTSSDESSNGNEKSMPGSFDGTSDPPRESESKSESKYRTQAFGLDGAWDDYGPPPPPREEPKMGRIEMTSEPTGTWHPVGQASRSSNAMGKTERWTKRSDSREHFRSDFQKHASPAGSQRGHSGQTRSATDRENVPPLNLRGGGPGSYSIASSEAMRNWNRGPPATKSAQEDTPWKGGGGPPAALDPWTANIPIGDLNNEAETKPQTQGGTWGTVNETKNKPRSKKGRKGSVVSRSPNLVPGAWGENNNQDQSKGNVGNDWGTSGDIKHGDDAWGGATHNEWNLGGDHGQGEDDDVNDDSNSEEQNRNGKKDDGAWDSPNGTSNGNKDDWGGDDNNDMQQNGDWGTADDDNPKQDDNWGATTGNDVQQGNSWGGETGQQTDNWGGDDTKQATTGAKDPEKVKTPTGSQSAANGGKAVPSFSFGNSRATVAKPVPKVGPQSKPVSMKSKGASTKSNKFTFDWLKPSLEKVSDASGSPVVVEKASVQGAWPPPVTSPEPAAVKAMAAQGLPTFSISTLPKPKPYWSTWRNPNTIAAETEHVRPPSPEELEEPLYSIPAEVAQRNMMSHQVRPGRPAAYTHKRNKPKYLDTHEDPYAVFLFKYRDKEIIEYMLKTTIGEPEVDEKARLASLSKQELIDELTKTKLKLSVVKSESSGQATFVKKLDEKLSRLKTRKEDVPAVGNWVKTTSPTNGQEGIATAGAWAVNDAQKGNGEGSWAKDENTSKTGHENSNGNVNGNGGESWGGDTNGKNDWNDNKDNNGNGEASHQAEESGNDWTTANNHNNDSGNEEKDDNGGGGDWNNDNDNSGDAKAGDGWGNDNHDGDGNQGAGEWGNDHDQGGRDNGWDNNDGGGGGGGDGGDGGWGGDDGKKDDNAGFESSWGANTGGGGGGGGGGGVW